MDAMFFIFGFLGFLVLLVLLIKNLITKKPKKKIGIGMIACLIIMIIGMSLIPSQDSDEDQDSESEISPTVNVGDETIQEVEDVEIKAIQISALDLYNEYKDNEVAADIKYKKGTIEVTGTINNIGKDILDTIYITLDVGEYFDSVQCFFKDNESESVAELIKGEEVTIIGTCDGKSITNVVIKNSKIKK